MYWYFFLLEKNMYWYFLVPKNEDSVFLTYLFGVDEPTARLGIEAPG